MHARRRTEPTLDAPAPTLEAGLDPTAPCTLHSQISQWLRERITTGDWPEHYRLPAEPDLASQLGVSRGTLRRAVRTLVGEGLLVQTRGRGTFVATTVVEPPLAQRLTTLSEALVDAGHPLTTTVIGQEVTEPPAPVAALLEIDGPRSVLRLERVRHLDGTAVARLVNYVRLDLAAAIEHVDFAAHTLFAALEHTCGVTITSARRRFDAVTAGDTTAALLGISPLTPLLHLEQLTFTTDEVPLEFSDVWLRADRLRVTSHLTRT
ncbi:UTRA domain-containing protein [Nostocoides sp. F2B08]|uniref:GntR family transcriptional regulator n=1 Tax=Nostocoides sp. F2B08 TaxID=2653936 RepID=UPI001263B160|nr:GntR family transcriptional regulator [Tetrasphaera sp. F2B08]KAB7745479.1 UTRA domain-containing protein [Tetrasphaera sp. F2B08]